MADIDYLQWAERQDVFSSHLISLRQEKMPHWGSFEYHVSIPGWDTEGNKRLFRFNIRQLFCESFCRAEGLDYSFYLRAKDNASKIEDLFSCKRHYTSCVYDKVVAFLLSMPEAPLVVFEHSNLQGWENIDGFHFDYLRELLVDNGVAFIDSSSSKKYLPNISTPIVVVELVTNNDRMLYNCEQILKASSGKSSVCYISLLKEYDREEMAFLIDEEKNNTPKEDIQTSPVEVQQAKPLLSEYDKLLAESTIKKEGYIDFKTILEDNGISYLYHFTDRRNLDSIKQHGGLLSWFYCEKNNIHIPYPGGDSSSKSLDKSFHLEDYVRLSFCENHPMSWRLQQQGYDLVLLKVKIDAAWMRYTMFSDINAADMCHSHGGTLSDLKKVDFTATKQHYVRRDSSIFKTHQAEVLVKTFLPIEYIINFDNPDII